LRKKGCEKIDPGVFWEEHAIIRAFVGVKQPASGMVSLTIECFCEEYPAESGVSANSVSLLFAGGFVRDHRAGNAPSRVRTPSVPNSGKDCG